MCRLQPRGALTSPSLVNSILVPGSEQVLSAAVVQLYARLVLCN